MAFFTKVIDLQAALSACLTVRDWEMLTEAVQIPENFIPLAFPRFTELTVQELEVIKITSANFNESAIVLVIALPRKFISETFSLFETFIMKMAFSPALLFSRLL